MEDDSRLRLWVLNDGVIRIRLSFDGKFIESSYCLVLTAWNDRMDEVMKKYRNKIVPLIPELKENDEAYSFCTKELKCTIFKDPYGITI